jgi:hypothetical protein
MHACMRTYSLCALLPMGLHTPPRPRLPHRLTTTAHAQSRCCRCGLRILSTSITLRSCCTPRALKP